MLESIRTGIDKPWVKIVLGAVILSFIFAGVFTVNTFGGSPNAVATVNGEEITIDRWNEAVNQDASRFGEQFDLLFPTDQAKQDFRKSSLERLANSIALEQEVSDLGFAGSEQQILELVTREPSLQLDGQFSPVLFDQLLSNRRITRDQFKVRTARSIAQVQFNNFFANTEFALPNEVARKARLEQQTRNVSSLVVAAAPLEETVTTSEEELAEHYQNNLADYVVPESLEVEYLELKTDSLAESIEVSDEDAQAYYTENEDAYRSEEERRVAHILIKTDERTEADAIAKAEQLAAQLAQGADFAELAKAESEDFSAEDGGDLGFSARGAMPDAFEQAMFELALDQVSEPVTTEFGVHLIKLLELKDGAVRPFEEVKPQIVARLTNERAEDRFYELRTQIEDDSFNYYESLARAAENANLTIQTSGKVTRTGNQGIFSNQAIIEQAFSPSVLNDGRNSSVVDINDNHLVVLRSKSYTAEYTRPLEEVSADVAVSLKRKKARELAAETGENLLAKLNGGESVATDLTDLGLSWTLTENVSRSDNQLSFELIRFAFEAPKPNSEGPIAVGKTLSSGDYLVMQVTLVNDPDVTQLSDAEKEQTGSRVLRGMSDSAYGSFVGKVSTDANIELIEERIN